MTAPTPAVLAALPGRYVPPPPPPPDPAVAALAATPAGTTAADRIGRRWTHVPGGRWRLDGSRIRITTHHLHDTHGPITVLHRPA